MVAKEAITKDMGHASAIINDKYDPIRKKCQANTQNLMILDWLIKHKTITQRQAAEEFNCFRLSARIKDLRDRGAEIETEMVPIKSKAGHSAYAKYTLL